MTKYLLLILLIVCCWAPLESRGAYLPDIQSLLADSSGQSADVIVNNLIQHHPLVREKVVAAPGDGKIRPSKNQSGPFFGALALLFVFAGVRVVFERHVNNLIKIFTQFSISKRQLKDQLENDSRASVVLKVLYFISTGYLLFAVLHRYTFITQHRSTFISVILCTGLMGGLFILKSVLIHILAWVFQNKEAASLYQFNTSLAQEFAALLLFPLCILLVLSSSSIYQTILFISVIVFSVMLIYKYIRISGILKKMLRVDIIHFLLYLCAFEIIPILTLARLVSE
ncbi:MAG TPA: DUF4271 domain-containing protein [Chitinophagaceae bacterium]|nr:DUF4271 domain-containing protein [Chitinophagaceae bacterium]